MGNPKDIDNVSKKVEKLNNTTNSLIASNELLELSEKEKTQAQLLNIGATEGEIAAETIAAQTGKEQTKTNIAEANSENLDTASTNKNVLATLKEAASENITKRTTQAADAVNKFSKGFRNLGTSILSSAKAFGTFLLTDPVGWALAAVGIIGGVAIGVANYKKKIHEAAEAGREDIERLTSSIKSQEELVKTSGKRYAELAQQVSNLGTAYQSQGQLSTDDYQEFLDISNELAETYPSLVKGYDDAGNAILDLNGSAETIVGTLNDLLNTEKQLANQEILKDAQDVWKEDGQKWGAAKDNLDDYQKKLQELKNAWDIISNDGLINVNMENAGAAFNSLVLNSSLGGTQELADIIDPETGWYDFSKATQEQKNAISKAFSELNKEYSGQINKYQNEVNQYNAELSKYLFAYLSFDDAYTEADDIHTQQLEERNPIRYYEVDWTKNEKGISQNGRNFPMTSTIKQLLNSLKEAQQKNHIESKYIFCREDNEWVPKRSYEKALAYTCSKLKLPKTNNHALRMSLNSNVLIPKGIPVTTRAKILGHSVETNLNFYSFESKDYIQESLMLLNA